MTLLIDTGVVPAEDRVDFWASSSCDVYHPLHIRTDASERFSARMWGDWLASVGLSRVAASPKTMSRTRGDIAAGDPECLHFSVLLRGRLEGAQQHRESVLSPGDMTSYDTSQPAIFRAGEDFDMLVLKLPKAMLGKHAAKVSRLTAVRIPGKTGLPRLAAQFFCGAAAGRADGSIDRHDAGLAEHVIDLVRRLYADLDATHPMQPRSSAELILHAQSYIEANLGDPNLDPEQVARSCFISTRYLHRVFADAGLSVCDWIRTPVWSDVAETCWTRRSTISGSRSSPPAGGCRARRTSAACSGWPTATHREFRHLAVAGAPPLVDSASSGHGLHGWV